MRHAVSVGSLLLAVAACGRAKAPTPVSPTEQAGSREEPNDVPEAPVEPESAADAGAADAAPSDAAQPPAASLFGIEPAVLDALQKESVFQGRTLADDDAMRKLDPDGKYARCAAARFGANDGWFCEVSVPEMEKTGHSVFLMAAVRSTGTALKELYRFPYQARALDFPEAIYATLRAEYDDTSGTLKLTDGAFPCERAVASEDTSLEFQRVVNRLCKARGSHVWKGATFQHKDKLPALRWKGPPRKAVSGF